MIDPDDADIIGIYRYRTLMDKVPPNVRLKVKPFSTRHIRLWRASHLTFEQVVSGCKPRTSRDDVRILLSKYGKK